MHPHRVFSTRFSINKARTILRLPAQKNSESDSRKFPKPAARPTSDPRNGFGQSKNYEILTDFTIASADPFVAEISSAISANLPAANLCLRIFR